MPNPTSSVKPSNRFSHPVKKTPQQQRDELQDARLDALEKNQQRQDKKTQAIMSLMALQSEVRRRTLSWQTAAKYIGSAYVMAYEKHKEILGKKNAQDALNIQIIFSILTVASAGSLAWIGLSDRFKAFGQVLTDSIEDAAQAGIGEIFSAIGPLATPMLYSAAAPIGPAGIEPQIYQNRIEATISSRMRNIEEQFKKIIDTLKDVKLEQWDKYDVKKQMERHQVWLQQAAQFSGVEDLPIGPDGETPHLKWMAEELERGIWSKYILSQYFYRDFGLFETKPDYEFPGWEVYDRLVELGVVPSRKELSRYSIDRLHPAIEEESTATKFSVKWAKKFEPMPFEKMRRLQEVKNAALKYVPPPILKFFGSQQREIFKIPKLPGR
jgi:hypothetical protein